MDLAKIVERSIGLLKQVVEQVARTLITIILSVNNLKQYPPDSFSLFSPLFVPNLR